MLLLTLFLLSAPAFGNLISDPGFDGAFSNPADNQIWNHDNGDAFGVWYTWLDRWQVVEGQATRSDHDDKAYAIQVIEGKGVTGRHRLSFDYGGDWSGYVRAIGYDDVPTFNVQNGPPSGGSGLFAELTELGDQLTHQGLSGDPPPYVLDFGEGHNYLVFAFSSTAKTPREPWIDNFRVTPEPATLALLGAGGLCLLRRRRSA
jgi:hypothetical protein